MSEPARSSPPAELTQLSEDTVRRMLEVQAADLGVRRQELEVRSQELLHNKEYAVSLLEA